MRAARKIIVFSSLFLLILAGLLAAAVYLYRNPEIVAAHAEQYFSNALGLDIRSGRVEWSLRPLRIEAGEVSISSLSKPGAFQLEIQEIGCGMHLDGRFGRRVLVVDYIRAVGMSVEIQDMDFGDPGERSKGENALEGLLGRLAGFFLFRDISIGEISIEEGDVHARFEDVDFTMSRLSARRGPDGPIEIAGEAGIRMPLIGLELAMPDVRLALPPGISFPSVRVTADLEINDAKVETTQMSLDGVCARFDLDADFVEKSVTASKAVVSVGNVLKFNGSLEGRLKPRPAFGIAAERCAIELSDFLSIMPLFTVGGLPQLKADGILSVSGRAGGAIVNERWNLEGNFEALLEKTVFSWKTAGGDLRGVVSGASDFLLDSGGFPAITRAGMVISEGMFSNDAAVVEFTGLEMHFSGRHPAYEIERFAARIPRADLYMPGNRLTLENIYVAGSGSSVDFDTLSVDFPDVSISLQPAGNFSARARIRPGASHISVVGKDAGLIQLAGRFGLVPVGWDVYGTDEIQIEASLDSEHHMALKGKIKLESVSFEDPTGRFIGEGLSAWLAFDGTADMESGFISGELSAGAGDGEVLFDLFYMDLGRNPFRAGGAVEFFISERRARVARYGLGFENLFDFVVEGTAVARSIPSGRLDLHLSPASLSPLYDFLVRGPFGRRIPFLNGLRPEGMISAELELSGTPVALSVRGGIKLRSGSFSFTEKEMSGRGISLDLPVWIETGSGGKRVIAGVEPLSGRFSVADLRMPLLPAQHFDFTLEAAPNRIRIP
ncbi:MAG TPA: hypothetical protein ENN79_16600, partial [Desulfobacteraceae bacterium]|nr:hypothetical protein [Desulfobacteraceae bacterium]